MNTALNTADGRPWIPPLTFGARLALIRNHKGWNAKEAGTVCAVPDIVLLTTSEVAERFRVHTSVVRRWVSSGKLTPAVTTPGGHYRFDEASISEFMAAS